MRRDNSLSRRSLLAGATGGVTAGLAGCLDRFLGTSARSEPDQISFTIKTLPADEDTKAIQIARQCADNFEAVGIDVTLDVIAERALLTDVLYNHDFDVFVTPFPGIENPDELRPLLHSEFTEESGWQNPFGFASPRIDDLLETLLEEPDANRSWILEEIQRELIDQQPFSVIAYPDLTFAVASWIDEEWELQSLSSFESLLRISTDQPPRDLARIGVLTKHITENRNPLAAEYRGRDNVLELVYDPLIKVHNDELIPWLATDWTISDQQITIQLRSGVEWHDGEPLTPSDVAFTYEFLQDTSKGEADVPIPAPRFRDRSSRIDSVSVSDDDAVELTFRSGTQSTAPRLLTVPVLPEHIWESRSEIVQDGLTAAITAPNDEPIGTGPLQFADGQRDEFVQLERVDGHFIESAAGIEPFSGELPFERLEFTVEPNFGWIIERITNGEMAATATPIESDTIETVETTDGVRLLTEQTNSFYMIGYNTRHHPLGVHTFRNALSRFIDREQTVETVFEGRAEIAETPVLRSGTVPDEVQWTGASALGAFPGTDGEIDGEQARGLLREIGFRYNDAGELLTQD